MRITDAFAIIIKITTMLFFFFTCSGETQYNKEGLLQGIQHGKTSNMLALSYYLYLHILASIQARLLIQAYLRSGWSRQRLQAVILKMCSSPTCLSVTCYVPNRCDILLNNLQPIVYKCLSLHDDIIVFLLDGWCNHETEPHLLWPADGVWSITKREGEKGSTEQ